MGFNLAFIGLNAAFAMTVVDSISHVHPATLVTKLPKQLKYTTKSSCPYGHCPLNYSIPTFLHIYFPLLLTI